MRDDWELENHPYTPAGEIEGFGRFAAGINRRRRRGAGGSVARAVAIVLVVALVVPVVVGLVFALVG